MICSSSVSLSATTSDRGQQPLLATIVAARALSAYILGAALRGVTLYGGGDFRCEGCSDAEAVALEAVVQAVVCEVRRLANAAAFGAGDDVYRPANIPACGSSREILASADVQRALDALTTALLIHKVLTGDEMAEIILTALIEE